MAWAFDQQLGSSIAASPQTLTTTNAVAAGGLIILCAGHFLTGATVTVSGGGLTWSEDVNIQASNHGVHILSAYAPAGLAAGTALTVTFSSGSGPVSAAMSFTGAPSKSVDKTATFDNTVSSTAWVSGTSAATIGASDLIIGAAYTADSTVTDTPNAGYTAGFTASNGGSGLTLTSVYQLNAAPGTYQAGGTWNGAVVAAGALASYIGTATTVAPPRNRSWIAVKRAIRTSRWDRSARLMMPVRRAPLPFATGASFADSATGAWIWVGATADARTGTDATSGAVTFVGSTVESPLLAPLPHTAQLPLRRAMRDVRAMRRYQRPWGFVGQTWIDVATGAWIFAANSAAPFPSTPILDDFNRTAENPLSKGGAWVTSSGPFGSAPMQSTGTQANAPSPGNGSSWGSAFPTPAEVYVDIPVLSPSGYFNLLWVDSPTSGTANGYELVFNSSISFWQLNSIRAGSVTTLTSGSATFTAGDAVGLSIKAGGVVTAYQRTGGVWSVLSTATDGSGAAATSGYPGMLTPDTTITLDNFGGGTAALESFTAQQTASGAVILGGAKTESRTGTNTAAGSVTFAGSGVESPLLKPLPHTAQLPLRRALRDPRAMRQYVAQRAFRVLNFADSATGAWIWVGGRTDARTGADAGSGAVILGGAKTESRIGTNTASGAVTFVGSGVESPLLAPLPHTAQLPLRRALRDPRAMRAYTRPQAFPSLIFTDAVTGAWIWAGGRTESRTAADARSGAWIWAGGRLEARTGADTSAGTVTLQGWAIESPLLAPLPHTAQLPLRRALRDPRAMRQYIRPRAFATLNFVDAMLGSWIWVGAKTEARTAADTRTGTWIWAGSRTESRTGADTRSGAVIFGGTKSEARVGTNTASGAVIFGGTKTATLTHSSAPSGAWVWVGGGSVIPTVIGTTVTYHLVSESRGRRRRTLR